MDMHPDSTNNNNDQQIVVQLINVNNDTDKDKDMDKQPKGEDQQLAFLSYRELMMLFLGFGINAWGGPMAQINMLREELVERRKWMTNAKFMKVYAVYQALPGPEAMELCCYFGYLSRGRIGCLIGGFGFLLPGFTFMLLASWWYKTFQNNLEYGLAAPFVNSTFSALQPLIAAMVVRATMRIAQSSLSDSHSLHNHPDRSNSIYKFTLFLYFLSALDYIMGINFLIIFLITGLAFEGFVMKKNVILIPALIVNIVLIILVSLGSINQSLDFLSNLGLGIAPSPEIWRLFILGFLAGLLSFGGAYAAIPYVQQEAVILGGWISLQAFLDGIAIVQVLPAPLVIFSTFVGFYGNTWGGAFIMTIGMFLPAFAFTLLGHNLFEKVIENEKISVFLDGITAGVVGLITCTAISITKFALTDPNYAQFNVLIFLASLWSLHTFKSFKYLNPCMVAGPTMVCWCLSCDEIFAFTDTRIPLPSLCAWDTLSIPVYLIYFIVTLRRCSRNRVNKILAGAAILAALGGFWDRYSVAHVISSVLLVSGLVFQIFAVNVLNLVAPAASAIVYAGHCVLYGIMFPGQVWIISVKVIACLAILFALNNASKFSAFDREEEKDNVETIETKAGILSQLFFWWSLPMIVQGYRKKELVMSDLVLVSTRNKPEIAFEKFSVYYNQKNRKSLLRVLYEMNIDSFWNCGAILLFSTIVGYLSPIILQFLLDHIASDRSDYVTGIIISFILFATKVIQSVTEHQFWIIGVRCGMRCQSALMAQVYKKALKLSNSSLKKYSIGEIVNLMSVDACRISDSSVIQLFHWGTWCALLTSIISLVGLYNLLGYSMFFGIAIISSFWPVSIYLSRKVKATSLEVQKRKDQRARYAGNAVGALKLVKSLQWENYILKILGMKRDAEIDSLVKRSIYGGVIDLWSNITQTAAPIGTFLIFSLVEGKDLSASVVFTSLTWFSMLNRALSIIPGGITSLMDTLASMERLESFFTASEIWNSNFIEASPSISKSTVISIKDAGFSWNEDHVSLSDLEVDGANKETDTLINSVFLSINSTPVTGCLHDINLTITEGEMVFIVGPVGCGKSSLLSSIMGECFLTGGKMQVFGRKAYVSHNPWFQNTSIRENIIFGKPFNQSRYEDTLEACMLVDDLHRINGADLSEVGEDGCNLSGGQKQRLSLARAVYSDADLYLLDDVLSALDSHVALSVFNRCLVTALSKKTRVVITHQTTFLSRPEITRIYVLSPFGGIYDSGTYFELVDKNDEYISKCLFGGAENKIIKQKELGEKSIEKRSSTKDLHDFKKTIVVEETKAKGRIDPKILVRYLNYFESLLLVLSVVIAFALEQITTILNSWWLSRAVSDQSNTLSVELYVYAALGFGICLFSSVRIVLFVFGGVRSAKNIHKSMVGSLLRAPIKFYDQQLTGRILNRLVSDQSNVDSAVPSALSNVLSKSLYFGSLLVILGCAFPYLLIVVIALGIPYYLLSAFYRWSARDIRRLEAMKKSPINSHFHETLKGLSTIRSFRMESSFTSEFIDLLEINVCCFWNRWCTNQWVTVWLEFLGTLFTLSFSLLSVWASYSSLNISAGLVGLLLSYAVQVPSNLGWLLKLFVQAEVEFVSLERIIEYIDLSPEDPNNQLTKDVGQNIKVEGQISVKGLKMKYDDQSEYVLKGIDMIINAKTKVAVIGRTASGKSSLFSALLKFYPFEGKIRIDGLKFDEFDISRVRSIIRLIPQTASLIGEAIKDALCGPSIDLIDDKVVWNALESVQMEKYIHQLENGIHTLLSEIEFSAGQKQLLCLARALLNPAPILLCDEITANVDFSTERIIHELLFSSSFSQSTIIFICHRLHHIQQFNQVFVMENGNIMESGDPNYLLSQPDSILCQMFHASENAQFEPDE